MYMIIGYIMWVQVKYSNLAIVHPPPNEWISTSKKNGMRILSVPDDQLPEGFQE